MSSQISELDNKLKHIRKEYEEGWCIKFKLQVATEACSGLVCCKLLVNSCCVLSLFCRRTDSFRLQKALAGS